MTNAAGLRFRATLDKESLDIQLLVGVALLGSEIYLADDVYAALYRASDRTAIGVDLQYPLYLLAVLLFRSKMESLLYSLDNEDFAFCLYLPHRVGVEVVKRNLTRCQRAPKGAEQSTARRRNEVVKSRRVWLFHVGANPIVLGDLRVDSEENRLFPAGYVGAANLALYRLYSDLRGVGYIGHVISFPYGYTMVPQSIRFHTATPRWAE